MDGNPRVVVFQTKLGWFAVVGTNGSVSRLTFAHTTAADALRSAEATEVEHASPRDPLHKIARRLTAYANGKPDDFCDITVSIGGLTPFQRRVVNACRRIRPGKHRSYADLAAAAGKPRAARAVGGVMARNPIPIIVPCHRVLASGGGLGGYSAGSGIALKRRLLRLERHPAFC